MPVSPPNMTPISMRFTPFASIRRDAIVFCS
jgi:hypothetical protein